MSTATTTCACAGDFSCYSQTTGPCCCGAKESIVDGCSGLSSVVTDEPEVVTYTSPRDAELITVLINANALWYCYGPKKDTEGVSSDALLVLLQTSYPESAWDLELLLLTLAVGRKQGRYKEFPVDTWFVNTQMAYANPAANSQYTALSSAICPPRCWCPPQGLVY